MWNGRPSQNLWEFHEALLEAATLEDLPGKWYAALLKAEQNRSTLRIPGELEALRLIEKLA